MNYLDNATAVFPQLCDQFSKDPGWGGGCAFDSMLDYFLIMREHASASPDEKKVLIDARSHFSKTALAWYDDWAWWGIATSKAFDPAYEKIFGRYAPSFRAASVRKYWEMVEYGLGRETMCERDGHYFFAPDAKYFSDMSCRGTRNSWRVVCDGDTDGGQEDYLYFTSPDSWVVPRHEGGCWQFDMSRKGMNPVDQSLGCQQVTLMQGLYVSFACCLAQAARRKQEENKSGPGWDALDAPEIYEAKAAAVVDFLLAWMEEPASTNLQVQQGANRYMLFERVPAYKDNPTGTNKPPFGFQSNFFWAGDQGLIAGALCQYATLVGGTHASGSDDGSLIDRAVQIVAASLTALANDEKVVQPFLGMPPAGDLADYGAGTGVFWRYVYRMLRTQDGIRSGLKNGETIIFASGDHDYSADGRIDKPLFTDLAQVAAAVAAAEMSA
jgi:hypothetical protein